MKKIGVFLLAFLLILLLCACESAGDSNIYTVEKDGITFTVNAGLRTISDGTNTYEFSVSGGSSYEVKFTYPNGATWWWYSNDGMGGYGGYSNDYDENTYVPGRVLLSVIEAKREGKNSYGNVFLGLILICIGVYDTVYPKKAWYLTRGWKYKNLEPSDASLALTCLGGVAVAIIGIIVCFV